MVGAETQRRILRSNDPGIIWQATIGVGSIVRVDQLASRLNPDLGIDASERNVLFVFDEVKQMGVGPAETVLAIDAKGVIPNDPAATMEASLLSFDFKLRRILVANGQPKRPIGFERAVNAFDPLATPTEIIFSRLFIVVDIVFIADIERGIGEHQIDTALVQLGELLNTITLMNLVFFQSHGDSFTLSSIP